MNTPVRVCPYYDAACNELPMKCEFCPERAPTASAITDEQIEAAYTAYCYRAMGLTPLKRMRKALEAAAALAAPTAQPVGQEKRDD